MVPMFRLDNKTALITGGNRGIGFAIASAMADAGGHVVLIARDQQKLEQAVTRIRSNGGSADFRVVDLELLENCDSLINWTLDQYGKLDILVNNAGINKRLPALELDLDEYRRIITTNLHAVFALCQAAGRHMVSAESGKIINIGSLTSTYGLKNVSAYAASKGGLLQLTRALATEWARYNVQVNLIAPGFIRTDLNQRLWEEQEISDWVIGNTPAGRLGRPEDIAGAAVFLASSASDFITGISLTVDGGVLGGGPWPIT